MSLNVFLIHEYSYLNGRSQERESLHQIRTRKCELQFGIQDVEEVYIQGHESIAISLGFCFHAILGHFHPHGNLISPSFPSHGCVRFSGFFPFAPRIRSGYNDSLSMWPQPNVCQCVC